MPETRVEIAEQILRSAGKLILKHFGRRTRAQEEEPEHLVTPVDLAVDQLVIDWIRQKFPKDTVFTEETGFVGNESEYLWVVDPVDGTSNLTLGFPYVATGLAVQYAGETVLSAVYDPFLDEMIVAEKGSGAFLNGERLHVSDKTLPSVGYYVQGYRVPPPIQLEVFRMLLPEVQRILNTWAPTLDWCNIARGRAEFLVSYDTEAEDLIQGKLILEEAGGKVTTWNDRSIHLDLRMRQRVTALATNGAVHEQLCELLERVSLAASLQGYVSSTEERSLEATLECLSEKLCSVEGSVAERISAELGLPRAVWERSADFQYLFTQAEALRCDPRTFLYRIFDGVAPHLSGEKARKALLHALERVVEAWEPEEYPLEVAAQALEIAASDVRLHDRMQVADYNRNVVKALTETLPEDSFAVGVRLKRNAFRKLQALEGIGGAESLGPVCQLADLPLPTVESVCPREGTMNRFAALIITAGRGTRLRTSVPKGLIPLCQRPLVNYTIEALRAAGATDITVVIGYKGELHRPILSDDLTFLEQVEQLGTAHAVMAAKPYFAGYEGPLLACYSDMPFIEGQTLRAMVDKHCTEDAVMTFLTTDRKRRPEFGRVLRRRGKICGIGQVRFDVVESDEVDAGFYCFKAPEFWEYLGRVQNANNRREFVLTEIVARLSEDDQKIGTYSIDDFAQTLGINRPSELIQAERIAYTRSKLRVSDASPVKPETELYWKLRFYEAFGGVRADEILKSLSDLAQLNESEAIIAAYDDAVVQEIGPIFRCPEVSRLPRL